MNFLSLVFVNLGRNKRRTILTLLSVTVAVFLFCLLGSVLDTLEDSIKVGSQSRLVTRNKVSLIFPMPLSYQERIRAIPGVKQTCIQNWFGGTDPKNPRNFFAQFAVTPEFYDIYGPEFDLVEYRDMVAIVRDRIQAMVKKGMTLDQVKAARPTLDYDSRYGATTGPWTTDQFVEAVFKSLTTPRPTSTQ